MVYHVTTPKKLERYRRTGCILPPVRFWLTQERAELTQERAERWMRRTGRTVLLTFECPNESYPLPTPRAAAWSPDMVKEYTVVDSER
jgi:hypothetical protein